ncbi:hypothetical protein, partial [Burkholderia multivorans]|uniref:hypothetical protein n=1 Tax=Burkholderia multivorans TaxID=87883 RepID=UPI001E5B9AA4
LHGRTRGRDYRRISPDSGSVFQTILNVLPIVGYLRGLAVVIVLGMVVGVIAVRLVNRKLDRLKGFPENP